MDDFTILLDYFLEISRFFYYFAPEIMYLITFIIISNLKIFRET